MVWTHDEHSPLQRKTRRSLLTGFFSLLLTFVTPLVFPQGTDSTCRERTFITFEIATSFNVTSSLFVPQFVRDVQTLRSFICDKRFPTIRNTKGELAAVNALYLKALEVADYQVSRALLLSLFTVFEHRTLHLRIPLLSSVPLPLTFESDSLFRLRTSHLPSNLYPHSYRMPEGDRDKLQHFFAAAYLAYTTETQSFVPIVGTLVEWFEELCIVGGSNDWRDKAANEQGNRFASALLANPAALPSEYLTLPLEECK